MFSATISGGFLSIADMLHLLKVKWQQTSAVVLMFLASETAAHLFRKPGQSGLWAIQSQFFACAALTALLAVFLLEYCERRRSFG